MDFKARWTYSNSILADPAGTIKQMAHFFNQSDDYKRSLFVNPSTPEGQGREMTGEKQTGTAQYETSNYVIQDATPSPFQPTYPKMPMSTHAGGIYAVQETAHVVNVNTATPGTSIPGMEGNHRDNHNVRQNNFMTS